MADEVTYTYHFESRFEEPDFRMNSNSDETSSLPHTAGHMGAELRALNSHHPSPAAPLFQVGSISPYSPWPILEPLE